MALSIAECRKNRGHAKGCITRAGNQVGHCLKADISTLDPATLTRIAEVVERADENFQVHHDLLYQEHDQMEADDYFHGLDEHHAQVMEVRSNLNTLSARLTATQALRRVETSLSLLELSSQDGFDPQLLEALPRTKALYMTFEDSSSHLTLSKDPLFD